MLYDTLATILFSLIRLSFWQAAATTTTLAKKYGADITVVGMLIEFSFPTTFTENLHVSSVKLIW